MRKHSLYILSALVFLLLAVTTAVSQTYPLPLDLGRPLFVHADASLDRDDDGLQDTLEYTLADYFKPYLFFDSGEKVRRPDEPKVLFQVRPEGCIGDGCRKPWRVWIAYAFLFLQDGGYGGSSVCMNAHKGDNDRLRIQLESNDGRIWKAVRVENSHAQVRDTLTFVWPCTRANVQWHLGHHVRIYMSGSKHHQYFDTSNDLNDSAYSSVGCNENVDGGWKFGAVLPSLLSPYPDNRPSNVGEWDHPDPAHFISALEPYGFPPHDIGKDAQGKPILINQTAWGGAHTFYYSGTPMKDLWMKHNFGFGAQFCRYVPPGVTQTRKRVRVTILELTRSAADPEMPGDSFAFDFIAGGVRKRYPATGTTNVAVGTTLDLSGSDLKMEFFYFCGGLPVNFEIRDAAGNVLRDSKEELKQDFSSGIYTGQIKRKILDDRVPPREIDEVLYTVKFRVAVVEIPDSPRRLVRTTTR
jgi:hypothetical protein